MALIFLQDTEGNYGSVMVKTGSTVTFDHEIDDAPPSQEVLQELSLDDLKVLMSRGGLSASSKATRKELALQINQSWASVLNGTASTSSTDGPKPSKIAVIKHAIALGIEKVPKWDEKKGKFVQAGFDRATVQEIQKHIATVEKSITVPLDDGDSSVSDVTPAVTPTVELGDTELPKQSRKKKSHPRACSSDDAYTRA
jgi:hypothetical protein